MSYYIARTATGSFESVLAAVVEQLKQEGFGVLTDIDVQATLENKLGVIKCLMPAARKRPISAAPCVRTPTHRPTTPPVHTDD